LEIHVIYTRKTLELKIDLRRIAKGRDESCSCIERTS